MSGGLDEPERFELEEGSLALALDGDDHTRADWEKAAADVLRRVGRLTAAEPDDAVWAELSRRTLDDVAVVPLGTQEHVRRDDATVRPTRVGAWDVRVEVRGGDTSALNREAVADLENGATSLWLHATDDLPALLDGVMPDLAPVVLDAPQTPLEAARAFLDLVGDTRAAPGTNLGIPAGAGEGTVVEAARMAGERGLLAFVVDASGVHDQGASDVQELAWSLATAVRLLRVLERAGIDAGETATRLEFRYAATDEQLPTIAKLRAARRLWAGVLEQTDAPAVAQRQHVVTSRPMLSKYDPWVNILRTTVAAFSAGVGGADAITVVPFDSPLGRPDAFGRRIARNTSAVLLAEAQLGRVADPAGGAYAVEHLTHGIARAAWDLFVELDGGASLDERISATAARRDRLVATRERPITGLTEFPHLDETLPAREPDPDAPEVRRYGAAFEDLRDQPATGRVFLATLGPVPNHTVRAAFAANLLASGGIAVDAAGATTGPADLVAAYAGQRVVCLAGGDAAYQSWGAEAAEALRAAGARRVLIAGRPVDFADDACSRGDDAVAFLQRTREALA